MPITDHDLIIRIDEHVAAIAKDVLELKSNRVEETRMVAILWNDRSIWNWVQRAFIVGTPVLVGVIATVVLVRGG